MKQKYQIGDKVYVLNGILHYKEIKGVIKIERYLGEDSKQTDTFKYCFNPKKIIENKSVWFDEENLYVTKEALLDNLSSSVA